MLPIKTPLQSAMKVNCCVLSSCADISVFGSFISSFVSIVDGDARRYEDDRDDGDGGNINDLDNGGFDSCDLNPDLADDGDGDKEEDGKDIIDCDWNPNPKAYAYASHGDAMTSIITKANGVVNDAKCILFLFLFLFLFINSFIVVSFLNRVESLQYRKLCCLFQM